MSGNLNLYYRCSNIADFRYIDGMNGRGRGRVVCGHTSPQQIRTRNGMRSRELLRRLSKARSGEKPFCFRMELISFPYAVF